MSGSALNWRYNVRSDGEFSQGNRICLEAYWEAKISPNPEAQHPKSSAIHKLAGRLPHLIGTKQTCLFCTENNY
jgi:hypothetical protein